MSFDVSDELLDEVVFERHPSLGGEQHIFSDLFSGIGVCDRIAPLVSIFVSEVSGSFASERFEVVPVVLACHQQVEVFGSRVEIIGEFAHGSLHRAGMRELRLGAKGFVVSFQ